jgi:hypothetical protein
MKRSRLITLAAVSVVALATFADGLSKFEGWDKSPLGYLMTAAERAQWASIKTDDEAAVFVKDFLARRGPEFVAGINEAAAAADTYLTVGTTRGSLTERGKLVIILGPPGSMMQSQRLVRNDVRGILFPAVVGSDRGDGSGEESSLTPTTTAGHDRLSEPMTVFVFTYPAEKLPAAYGKSLTVRIQVDPSGRDRVIDRKTQAVLDRLYEMVAEARLARFGSAGQ